MDLLPAESQPVYVDLKHIGAIKTEAVYSPDLEILQIRQWALGPDYDDCPWALGMSRLNHETIGLRTSDMFKLIIAAIDDYDRLFRENYDLYLKGEI